MKFCKDCKWYRGWADTITNECHECKAPRAITYNLVTGEKLFVSCPDMRMPMALCGPEAGLWEPKETCDD